MDTILLGFQHYVLALGSTVLIPSLLVPQMGGTNVRFQSISRQLLTFQFQLSKLVTLSVLNCLCFLTMQKDKAKVIQTLLFVSGVNTLLHSLFGTRLPSVIGGSYAFLIPATSIIHSRRYEMIHPPEQVNCNAGCHSSWFISFS